MNRLTAIIWLIALLPFGSCHRNFYIENHTHKAYAVSEGQDSLLAAMIAPYKRGVDTQMATVIGHTDIPLTKAQPESTLGNFMADAMLVAARGVDSKVEAAVANYGGIRLPYIAPGPLTRGRMYELMPFDNVITIVEIPGAALKEFCDHMARARGWPVSGLTYTISDKKAVDVKLDGRPVNDHIFYKLAVNDYMAKGGDNCSFLVPLKKKHTNIYIRDAMIEYVNELTRRNLPLHPELQNRVTYAE